MANEWVAVELYGSNNDGEPVRYTVDNSTNVSKGQLLTLADDRTVTATVFDKPVAGVAVTEKISGDGETTIACWTNGIFRATSSLAIAVGGMLTAGAAAANTVTTSAANLLNATSFAESHSSMRALDTVGDATELSVRLLC